MGKKLTDPNSFLNTGALWVTFEFFPTPTFLLNFSKDIFRNLLYIRYGSCAEYLTIQCSDSLKCLIVSQYN